MQFISPDVVADMLVQKDPRCSLIDVRALPRSLMPTACLGQSTFRSATCWQIEYSDILNQDAYMNVFYSNGAVYANQAWMITRQLGYENNFVLEGGLNYWFGNILSPSAPSAYQSKRGVREV
ncbi:MAG: rhodanese-like domain-containing protein [Marinilabiliales bacterium]|nr:rhodanese-like domain-containing protein [Marinilabiliales bacterium]